MRKLIPAAAVFLAFWLPACAPRPPVVDSLWDAVIVSTGGAEIPFRFEIVIDATDAQGFFFEGDRKVGSTSGRSVNGTLTFGYDFLNTTLELSRQGEAL